MEKQATSGGKKEKRKAVDDGVSAQKPRKLFQEQQDEQEDSEEGRSDVPTPTSSPGEDESQDLPDAEDGDIFKGKFASQKETQVQQDTEPAQAEEPQVFTTPKPRSRRSSVGATPSTAGSDDLRDLLAAMEDRLLATIPSSLTRTLRASKF